MANVDKIKTALKQDEGYQKFAYRCPAGKLTIGYGRNIDKDGGKGILITEADFLLGMDVRECISDLEASLPYWCNLPETVQEVLVNMRYNLGHARFFGFIKMLEYVKNGEYASAADEMMDSRWAEQVGQRAVRLSTLMASAENEI